MNPEKIAGHFQKILKVNGWEIILDGVTDYGNTRTIAFHTAGKGLIGTRGMINVPLVNGGEQYYVVIADPAQPVPEVTDEVLADNTPDNWDFDPVLSNPFKMPAKSKVINVVSMEDNVQGKL